MNKNNIIVGIVVIALVSLGIWFISSSNVVDLVAFDETTAPAASTNTNVPTPVKPVVANTFRSIFTQSGNHECLYEQVSSSGKSSSRVYIADGQMRGEFRTVSGDTTFANLMIYNGGYLYSWKEGATTGRKSSIKSMAELPEAIPGDLTSGGGLGLSFDNVSWDCHDWAKDPSMLVIPTYVKFS